MFNMRTAIAARGDYAISGSCLPARIRWPKSMALICLAAYLLGVFSFAVEIIDTFRSNDEVKPIFVDICVFTF
jgi:hypothetical protein